MVVIERFDIICPNSHSKSSILKMVVLKKIEIIQSV